jgi:hypothetical protein
MEKIRIRRDTTDWKSKEGVSLIHKGITEASAKFI